MNNTEKFLFRFTPVHGILAFLGFSTMFIIGYTDSMLTILLMPFYWLFYAEALSYTLAGSVKADSQKMKSAIKLALGEFSASAGIASLLAMFVGLLTSSDTKNFGTTCIIIVNTIYYYYSFYTSMKKHHCMYYFTKMEKYLSDNARYHIGDKVKVCMDKEDASIWNPVTFKKLKDFQNEGRAFEVTEIYLVDTNEIFYDIVVDNQIFKEVPERILFKEDEKEA